MKKTLALLLGCLTSLGACATAPPDITSIDYKNYEYEFYVSIPDGWNHVNLADSKEFFNVTPTLLGPEMIAYFGNPSLDLSILMIAANKSSINPDLLFLFTARSDIEKGYKKQFEQMKLSLQSNNLSVDCSQTIYQKRYLRDTANHSFTVTCDVQPQQEEQKPFKIRTEDYLYKCHEDDTCSLRFMLLSAEGDYKKNLEALTAMTENLRHILPPSPQK